MQCIEYMHLTNDDPDIEELFFVNLILHVRAYIDIPRNEMYCRHMINRNYFCYFFFVSSHHRVQYNATLQ